MMQGSRRNFRPVRLKDEIEILKDSSITVVSGGRNPIRDYVKAILDQAQFVNILHVAKILVFPLAILWRPLLERGIS